MESSVFILPRKKSEELGIPILSSDNLRKARNVEEVSNEDIFKELGNRAEEKIEEEKSFIWDSVNVNPKFRRQYIEQFRRNGAKIICLLMVTPKEICKKRNEERDRVVPDDAIEGMDNILDCPALFISRLDKSN